MSAEETKEDELHLEDPWLRAELEKESDSISDSWSSSKGFSQTVITLRLGGEEWCRVVNRAHVTTDNISNPIDVSALARAVANTVAKAFYEKLTKKILPSEAEMSSFDVEKFMYGLPEFIQLKTYASHQRLRGRENYWEWVRMITADLTESNLHLWIESMHAECTGLPLDVRLRYENQVQQILYASIEPKLHTYLVKFDSAWEIFGRLEERFGRQKTKDFVDLFNRLESVQVRPRQQMAQFLADFANLREEFRVRFPGLDDLFFCTKLLLKLKPWYPAAVQILLDAPKECLTFDLIRERILVVEKAEQTQLNARLKQQQRRKPPPFRPPNFDVAHQARAQSMKRNLSNFSPAFAETKKLRAASGFGFAEPPVRRPWRSSAFQPRNRHSFEPRGRVGCNANNFGPQQRRQNRLIECFGCGQRGHHIAVCPNANAHFRVRRPIKSIHMGLVAPNMRMTFRAYDRRGFPEPKYHYNKH